MSIFEPIPRESRLDTATRELDQVSHDEGVGQDGGSLDPRSIRIAGLVVAGIVATGLVVSNLAQPEARPRPAVATRVDPGAAAVEQVESKQTVPVSGASASPSAEPADETDATDDDAWVSSSTEESSNDDAWSGDSKRDAKPGKGHGRGRG